MVTHDNFGALSGKRQKHNIVYEFLLEAYAKNGPRIFRHDWYKGGPCNFTRAKKETFLKMEDNCLLKLRFPSKWHHFEHSIEGVCVCACVIPQHAFPLSRSDFNQIGPEPSMLIWKKFNACETRMILNNNVKPIERFW